MVTIRLGTRKGFILTNSLRLRKGAHAKRAISFGKSTPNCLNGPINTCSPGKAPCLTSWLFSAVLAILQLKAYGPLLPHRIRFQSAFALPILRQQDSSGSGNGIVRVTTATAVCLCRYNRPTRRFEGLSEPTAGLGGMPRRPCSRNSSILEYLQIKAAETFNNIRLYCLNPPPRV